MKKEQLLEQVQQIQNSTIAAGATGDLKLRDSVVVTVYARNIGKDLFQ